MHLLQKRRQKRPTKIGTRLLGSEMPVPISRSRTVYLDCHYIHLPDAKLSDYIHLPDRCQTFYIHSRLAEMYIVTVKYICIYHNKTMKNIIVQSW